MNRSRRRMVGRANKREERKGIWVIKKQKRVIPATKLMYLKQTVP